MDQEIEVLRYDAAAGAFVKEATVSDGGMERHRERHWCRYAKTATLTPAQRSAAAEAQGLDESHVLVFESRTTDALYVYRSVVANNCCHRF